jgi:hypothetical protein
MAFVEALGPILPRRLRNVGISQALESHSQTFEEDSLRELSPLQEWDTAGEGPTSLTSYAKPLGPASFHWLNSDGTPTSPQDLCKTNLLPDLWLAGRDLKGTPLPDIAAPLITASSITILWGQLAKDWDGVSVRVNDIERFRWFRGDGPPSFSWARERKED